MSAVAPSQTDGDGAGLDGAGAIVAVATSGGRDSIALLHATLRAAEPLGLEVLALHVHHGLLPEADAWAAAVEACCARWAGEGRRVGFACTRLAGAPAAGDSVEAWARRERYAALATMARCAGASLVLLAHHRRDQAETVLLQALRGAGPAGLAAMPRIVERDGLTWARPWLAQPAAAIDDYVGAQGLDYASDPSNTDPRYARSRLRASVMPSLRDAFPDAEIALAAVARHAHEARAVLDEVGLEDLRRIGAADDLPLAPWRGLSAPRRANALRLWLAQRLGRAAPDTLLRRLADETADDRTRRWPIDDTRGLRSWRGRLAVLSIARAGQAPAAPPRFADVACGPARATRPGEAEGALSLLRCDRYAVDGWPGFLEVRATDRHGIAPHRLSQVVARARVGGEQFQLRRASAPRSLKKQYQAVAVAAEGRGGPLLFDGDGALLFAPGLGIDARAWAEEGAPQWDLLWHAYAPGEG